MTAPWKQVSKPEPVSIIAPDGTERCRVQAYFAGEIFIIDDMTADLQPGDELRRSLPNGKDDVYRIEDPQLFNTGRMQAHYQVKVSRKGTFASHTGGHYINVSGANARVNIASTDNSTNIAHSGDVFGDMRQAIEAGVSDAKRKAEILAAVNEAEEAKDKGNFAQAYQKLVSTAADHLGLLLPFLPALTSFLG